MTEKRSLAQVKEELAGCRAAITAHQLALEDAITDEQKARATERLCRELERLAELQKSEEEISQEEASSKWSLRRKIAVGVGAAVGTVGAIALAPVALGAAGLTAAAAAAGTVSTWVLSVGTAGVAAGAVAAAASAGSVVGTTAANAAVSSASGHAPSPQVTTTKVQIEALPIAGASAPTKEEEKKK